MDKPWHEHTFIAFDLETSGAYPLGAEICEVAAVKWRDGAIIDTFQSLVAVSRPIEAKIIAIHGITNEMLEGAPSVQGVTRQFYDFIRGSILMAHHAQFDMGFLAPEMEALKLSLPEGESLCTSLLSRKVFPESPDHKLQTLIPHLGLYQGQAHRALDDSKSCLELGIACMEKLGREKTMDEVFSHQEFRLPWPIFSIAAIKGESRLADLIRALERREEVQIVYQGGSQPGQARTVRPLGIVRNAKDDYVVADDMTGDVPKRYFLKRISASRL